RRVELQRVAVDEHEVVVLAEQLDLPRQSIWREQVVRVEEREVAAARDAHALIPCSRGAADGGAFGSKTAVTVDVALDDSGCAVGRAVIDDDAFPVLERLREHTLERRGQKLLAIADRHDDADFDHGVQRASVALPTRSASHASWA